MKRILINSKQAEERRVALVEGNYLYDLDIESYSNKPQKSDIYLGIIRTIESSLEAAFVDFGFKRHGFLPLNDLYKTHDKSIVETGLRVIVQIEKGERGNKGAALTSQISLPGRYIVLMPNKPKSSGISRRIEGEERSNLREIINKLKIADDMSVIVRTASIGRSQNELEWDLEYLTKLWSSIHKASQKDINPTLIYAENNVIIRTLRDYMRDDIDEVLIDNPEAYEEAIEFAKSITPKYVKKIKLYNDNIHLFNRYQIEEQIESAYIREVKLPSGGSIVIDHTEALTSIDVNSANANKGKSIHETAINTNMEAALEVARQLRIRDMGGLVVIDFIDMTSSSHKARVESAMRGAIRLDRARVQMAPISNFGLMEMSRQRLRPSLLESSQTICPRCNGQGAIRDVDSLSLAILRIIGDESLKENTAQVHAKVPVEIAAYLLNEKREELTQIEQNHSVRVLVIPNPHLETPQYKVVRIKSDKKDLVPSHKLIPSPNELPISKVLKSNVLKKINTPSIKMHRRKHPKGKKGKGLFRRLWKFLSGQEYWHSK